MSLIEWAWLLYICSYRSTCLNLMDWTNVLQQTCKLACACYICLRTYHHHPSLPSSSLPPTQQNPQIRCLNIADIDEPLAKAAPVVKAAHDLNEDFLISMFQFKASHIHTCRDQTF